MVGSRLLRDVGEDLGGGFQLEDEPPPKWPVMALPIARAISAEDRIIMRKMRDMTRRMRESPVFAQLQLAIKRDRSDGASQSEKAVKFSHNANVKSLLAALSLSRTDINRLVPDELLKKARDAPKFDAARVPKRRRADSTTSVSGMYESGESRLNILEDEEKKQTGQLINAGEDDENQEDDREHDDEEPEDYIKNHYESEEEHSGGEEAFF